MYFPTQLHQRRPVALDSLMVLFLTDPDVIWLLSVGVNNPSSPSVRSQKDSYWTQLRDCAHRKFENRISFILYKYDYLELSRSSNL